MRGRAWDKGGGLFSAGGDGASPVSTLAGFYWRGVRLAQVSWSAMAAPVGS